MNGNGPEHAYDEETKDKVTEALNKINQASNETRIKLEALKACYLNVCQFAHQVACLGDSISIGVDILQKPVDWKNCNERICRANKEVLIKLELE